MSALDVQMGGTHYKDLPIQPVEFITKNNIPFCEGNAIKYLCRHRSKNGKEDLLKAKHYIDLLIEMEYPDDRKKVKVVPRVCSDDDGWIEWGGGCNPVYSDTLVQIVTRDNTRGCSSAGSFEWYHDGHPGDIIKYRVVKS